MILRLWLDRLRRPSRRAARRPGHRSPPGLGLLLLALVAAAARPAAGAEVRLPPGFVREVLAGPELPEPMDLAFAPDGALWITGRQGDLWRLDPATRHRHRVGRLPTDASGDRGLHGLALSPDFPSRAGLFVFYHAPQHPPGKYRSRVSRFEVLGRGTNSVLDLASERILLEFDGEEGAQHVGGGLLAHPAERLLYVTTGDNNYIWKLKEYCHDPANHAVAPGDLRGKVLRIGFDGSIPPGNPFAGRAGARGEVFTCGHRQPWQLEYDPGTRMILLAENGGDEADDHEEINRLVPGANYGWPRAFADGLETATRTNRVSGTTAPWFMYRRNQGGSCTGALLYRPPAGSRGFPARYAGGLFYSDYNRKSVRFAPVDPQTLQPGASEAFAQQLPGGPVALRRGPDGALYLVEYGGWFQATPQDAITRIVWRP